MLEELSPKDRQWLAMGVDIWMLRDNLRLSYEARLQQHQNTLDTIDTLQKMKRKKVPAYIRYCDSLPKTLLRLLHNVMKSKKILCRVYGKMPVCVRTICKGKRCQPTSDTK